MTLRLTSNQLWVNKVANIPMDYELHRDSLSFFYHRANSDMHVGEELDLAGHVTLWRLLACCPTTRRKKLGA